MISALLVLIIIIGCLKFQEASQTRQFDDSVNLYVSFIEKTQAAALAGEKYHGQVAPAYGVNFDVKNLALIRYADWNKNFAYDVGEELDRQPLDFKSQYTAPIADLLFLPFKKIGGVCFGDDCQRVEGESLIAEIKDKEQVRKVEIGRLTGEINIK